MLKIAIVDDLLEDRKKLIDFLEKYLTDKCIIGWETITEFLSGEEFLESKSRFDLIFMDIFMDGISGIDTAKKLRHVDEDAKILFITTSNDFASESYEVGAEYYLLKPYSYDSFIKVMDKVDLKRCMKRKYIIAPDGIRLVLSNILYTEFVNRAVLVHQKQGGDCFVRVTQKEFENMLSDYNNFACCMKGIIVNLNVVTAIESDCFVLKNGIRVPISRRKLPIVKALYSEHVFSKIREGLSKHD